jgi:glucose-1-phosphate cytidylyltransferase
MKVVILAGGLGSRISEYTGTIPKPMIRIGEKPILWHIMKIYSKFGYKDFYIALGHKGEIIKEYFSKNSFGWNINLIETGEETMTGGRIKRLKNYIGKETFMLTYGDGLSNININELLKFHEKNKKLVTMTVVRPPARFGVVKLEGEAVTYFKEKSKLDEGWINGGFFVIQPEFFNYIRDDKTYLEREPLEKLCQEKQLFAFKHNSFWQCMDTKRDLDRLQNLYSTEAPWLS